MITKFILQMISLNHKMKILKMESLVQIVQFLIMEKFFKLEECIKIDMQSFKKIDNFIYKLNF